MKQSANGTIFSLIKLQKVGDFGRDSEAYRRKHYRGHWQPAWAILGLISCILIVVFSGWPAIYLLKERSNLSPMTNADLKSNTKLAADLVGAYLGVSVIFLIFQVDAYSSITKAPDHGWLITMLAALVLRALHWI